MEIIHIEGNLSNIIISDVILNSFTNVECGRNIPINIVIYNHTSNKLHYFILLFLIDIQTIFYYKRGFIIKKLVGAVTFTTAFLP